MVATLDRGWSVAKNRESDVEQQPELLAEPFYWHDVE